MVPFFWSTDIAVMFSHGTPFAETNKHLKHSKVFIQKWYTLHLIYYIIITIYYNVCISEFLVCSLPRVVKLKSWVFQLNEPPAASLELHPLDPHTICQTSTLARAHKTCDQRRKPQKTQPLEHNDSLQVLLSRPASHDSDHQQPWRDGTKHRISEIQMHTHC